MTQGTQTRVCNNLGMWEGWRGWREVQEGGDLCVLMTDPHWSIAETNAIL